MGNQWSTIGDMIVKETGIKCNFCSMYVEDTYVFVSQAMQAGVKKYE